MYNATEVRQKNLKVGRYRVEVVDASGASANVVLDLEPLITNAVVIQNYEVKNTSTSVSRDGEIKIIGSGLQGWKYLWTNGVQTDEPYLRDVACGLYAAVPIGHGESIPMLIHNASLAKVEVSSTGRWGAA